MNTRGRTTLWARLRPGLLALALLGAPALGLGSTPVARAASGACTTSGSQVTCTFVYTAPGGPQTWTVPAGVTSATFAVYGAQGGNADPPPPAGGSGGVVTATIAVTPSDTLQVNVGGAGSLGCGGFCTGPGGFNGGGGGGIGSIHGGAGGGGASDVRTSPFSLTDRIIVAGGGGGAVDSAAAPPPAGGAGGGSIGADGSGSKVGRGGTQTTGGAGGTAAGGTAGGGGSLGVGGAGGFSTVPPDETLPQIGGGGGGGGYYGGGGGGYGGGGGGGSGYVTPSATGVVSQTGVQTGNGLVTITYTPPTTTTTTATTVSSSANPSVYGQTVTFTATVAGTPGITPTGTVTFTDGSTTLGTGTLSGGTATFNTSRLSAGSHLLTATYGGDAHDTGSTSAALSQQVNQAPLTITASSPSMTYGGTVPTITPSYSGFVNGDSAQTALTGAPSCSTTATSSSAVDSYPSSCAVGTLAATNYTFTFVGGTLTVTPAQLTVTCANAALQYSDPVPTLSYTLTGFVNGDSASVVSGAGSCTTTATSASPPGPYTITAGVGTLTAGNYTFSPVSGTLTVGPETAAIQYTGGTWAQLPSSGSATIPLQATVWDSAANGYPSWGAKDSDGLTTDTPGDVSKMYVQWAIWPAGGCLSGTPASIVGPVQVTASSTPGVGTAASSFAQTADGSFCVVAQVVGATANSTNGYYSANDAQVAGIAFYTNSGQFATGGGWVGDAGSSSGTGNFGFTARYGSTGKPKGQLVYVWRGTYNNTPADFMVKSNALTSLSFSKNSASSYSATLQGKCSYSIVSEVSGAQLYGEGNDTFSATVTDGDNGVSQNSGADSFALTTYQSGNTKLHPISTTALGGGNVAAHN